MAYTTAGEVRGVLSFAGSADTHSASGANDEQLEAAIEDARTEIDARLAVRYPAPFDDPDHTERPVPPVVARINRDLAAYLATLTFLRGAPLVAEHPISLRNAAAQNLLQGIATGKITLDLPGGRDDEQQPENKPGGATVINAYAGSMFTPAGFGIGPAIGNRGNQLGRPYPQDTY